MRDDSQAIFDELLVLKCRRGDVRAWQELVQRYERRLLYFIRRLVGSERDAWDLLQQTWMAAVKGIGALSEPRTLRTWLYRIARNNAVSHLRRRGIEAAGLDPEELAELPQAEQESVEDDWPAGSIERLHTALKRLSSSHQEVLTLHFLENASIDEIAVITGVPPGTVKSRLYYARRALRFELERRELP